MKTVDCRGLNCPEPVLRTRDALSDFPSEPMTVIVDNETARENVLRFIQSKGSTAEWNEKEGLFYITITARNLELGDVILSQADTGIGQKTVLFISTNELGQGSSELGQMLMRNFIYTLSKREEMPRAIVLMNSGVKLSIADSPVIEELEELLDKGVEILVCGTCLDYFELKNCHKAGQVSNMYDISDLLFAADRVITI